MKVSLPALLLTGVLSAATAFSDAANTVILFSTPGPDKYQDNSTVQDGEYYALVWTAGEDFAGFTADGQAANSAQKVIYTASLAKNGRCPLTAFQIDSKEAPNGGVYSVYLLDTRATTTDASSLVITGTSLAKTYTSSADSTANVKTVATDNTVASDGTASGLKSAAANIVDTTGLITPQITGIKVVDGEVKITVANVYPGIAYEVKGGLDRASSVPTAKFAEVTDGTVEVTVPEQDAKFFSIKLK